MRLAVFDVGGTAIKYAAMTDGEMGGKGEVPTPATCSGDFLAAIEGVLDALRAEGDIEGVALSLPGRRRGPARGRAPRTCTRARGKTPPPAA